MNATTGKRATIHRMVTDAHVCPYGIKAVELLEQQGYTVDDQWLTTRGETDAFKAAHAVQTTPLVFIDRVRVGGYDDLCRHLGVNAHEVE